jgi:hypothetical protein
MSDKEKTVVCIGLGPGSYKLCPLDFTTLHQFKAANRIQPSRSCLWCFSVVYGSCNLCQLDVAEAAWPPASFQSCWGAHLKRNLEKCQLFQKEVCSCILYYWESDHEPREAECCMGMAIAEKQTWREPAWYVYLLPVVYSSIHGPGKATEQPCRSDVGFSVVFTSRNCLLVPEKLVTYGTYSRMPPAKWETRCWHRQE